MYSQTSEEDRVNRYSAEEERGRLLLVTTVDLGDGLTDKIELRAGDCPEVSHRSHTPKPALKFYLLDNLFCRQELIGTWQQRLTTLFA